MKRIDAHQHFWQLSRGDYDWLTPALGVIHRDFSAGDLKPLIDDAKIDGTIIVQAASTVAETEYMLSIAAQNEWVYGVVGWVDMLADDASDVIKRLAKNPKLVGIRAAIEGDDDHDWILQPQLAPAIQTLIDLNLTFDCQGRVWLLKNLFKFFKIYPDLRCVIDHCAKPLIKDQVMQPWADEIAEIAQNTNVYCKLSGLSTEAKHHEWTKADIAPYAAHTLKQFGANRVMFGSDWPVVNLGADYKSWHEAVTSFTSEMTSAEKDAIFGGTAANFYLSRSG
ncbi:MAG: amidohydrolase family protein [Hyphomicrobiales bacterium]